MKYNHDRELEDFELELQVIIDSGFKPIAVSQIYFENTFVFEKSEEANKAYKMLEDCNDKKVIGFWYGKEDFEKAVQEYESYGDCKVRVYWLDI